MVTLPLRSLAN